MNVKLIRTLIGGAILCLAIVGSFWRVTSRNVHAIASDRIKLRIGHPHLQSGMREAFDAAIESYQRLHPNVSVAQVAVPQRIYPIWARTQLVGGTAVDILSAFNLPDPTRHFVSLTPWLDEPNPYNAGTSLEGVAWRDTFFDGLSSQLSLSEDVYAVMLQTVSHSLFINVELLREITGSDEGLPRDFDDLRNLAKQVRDYNQRTGKHIVPIASCRPYANVTFAKMLRSLTQKLVRDHSPNRTMSLPELDRLILDGTFSYSQTPEFIRSLELMSEISQMFTPGFLQFEHEDAIATYIQQRSLMVIAGTWDYGTLEKNAPFDTRALPVPTPSPSDHHYGQFTLGQVAESPTNDGILGIMRTSPNREAALDFLRYLSSQPVAEQFSKISQRLSAIVDTPIPPNLEQLRTTNEGEVHGFRVDVLGANANTLINRHIHLVIGLQPDIPKFAERVDAEITPYIRQDIAAQLRNLKRGIRDLDSSLALRLTLPESKPEPRATWTLYAEQQHKRQYDWLSPSLHSKPLKRKITSLTVGSSGGRALLGYMSALSK